MAKLTTSLKRKITTIQPTYRLTLIISTVKKKIKIQICINKTEIIMLVNPYSLKRKMPKI